MKRGSHSFQCRIMVGPSSHALHRNIGMPCAEKTCAGGTLCLQKILLEQPKILLFPVATARIVLEMVFTSLQMFTEAWNNHPLSSERNCSPAQLWITGLSRQPAADLQLTEVINYYSSFVCKIIC